MTTPWTAARAEPEDADDPESDTDLAPVEVVTEDPQ